MKFAPEVLSFMEVPSWELNSGFNPMNMNISDQPAWITLEGRIASPATHSPRAEEVINGDLHFNINTLPIRDPSKFISGQIHSFVPEWECIMDKISSKNNDVLKWIKNGVNVFDFFQSYKGNFKGKYYNSNVPPKHYAPNSSICKQYSDFIVKELMDKIQCGAIKLLGRVGECQPPRVVMPLTVEPSKPRLCHDERYINLWIKDLPFRLETLKDIHRLVDKNALLITCDEKSGYSHIKIDEESQEFFGIQFGGFFMVYLTLPFGWKASAFIYQSIGMCVTSYLRTFSVRNSLYIDDRFVATRGSDSVDDVKVHEEARRLVYGLVELLTRLGYTLALSKCSLNPSSCKRYLGFLVDSVREAYILPDDKKAKFIDLRESILERKEVDVKTLQRFTGKCISMSLVIPGCKLFCREINAGISHGLKNSRSVKISGSLKEEIEHWRFVDKWQDCSKWRLEFHKTISMYTDSSGFRYGACVRLGEKDLVLGDYWSENDTRPIHVKEADAILRSLLSLSSMVQDSRVDVYTDSMAVIGSWSSQGKRCKELNDIIKDVFQFIVAKNIDLRLTFVSSKLNEADKPSRVLSAADTMLSQKSWMLVETAYGPHSIDLMALDSNTMSSKDGMPLKHFTPCATPLSAGINVFCQDIRKEINPYVFPPFGLIFPIICLLEQQKVMCTIIVPMMEPLPIWWPKLLANSIGSFCIGVNGEKEIVKIPSKNGFVLDNLGLRWPLFAIRVLFV